MRFVRFSVIAMSLCLLLVACSKKEYSAEYSCRELCDAAVAALEDGEDYSEYGEEHLGYVVDGNTGIVRDGCVFYSDRVEDISEIGVLLADSASDARIIAEGCENYLEGLYEEQRAFISSYAPSELTKLTGATVRRYGNYVVYTVLDDAEGVFEEIERRLTE